VIGGEDPHVGPSGAPPDVEMGARVKAKRLRFERKPRSRVEFEGKPNIRSGSSDRRSKLPDEVEPGVTYRDVEVRWAAWARIEAE
jgi:hypothetical protein